MRSLTILSLFLLVSICAAGTACDTHNTNTPNGNAPVNSASPVATATPTQTASPAMSPVASVDKSTLNYSVYKDAKQEWRWRLQAANNRIIADSGESYHNKQDCLAGIELVKNSKDAPVSETTTASPPASTDKATLHYSVYQDAKQEWRWRLSAANNRIIADSGEGYNNKQDCLAGIELVKNSKSAPVNEKP